MVYVTDDGSVVKSTPWGLKKSFRVLHRSNLYDHYVTLINPGMNRAESQYTRDYRPGSGPRPPPRRLGRPNTGNNVDIPFFGGCSSCAR